MSELELLRKENEELKAKVVEYKECVESVLIRLEDVIWKEREHFCYFRTTCNILIGYVKHVLKKDY